MQGDDGAQRERTALAWQRTALSVMIASVAALRLASVSDSMFGELLALGGVSLAVPALVLARFGCPRAPGEQVDLSIARAGATAASIVALSCSALVTQLG